MTQGSMFSSAVPAPPRAGAYQVIYCDDAWPERGGGKVKRGADRHYGLMTIDDIIALPIGDWAAADAHIYMWATNNYLEAAFRVMRARRFRYVTTVTWVKDKAGLGQYFRGRTEHCLFGVRGSLPYRTRPDGKRAQGETVFYWPGPWDGDDLYAPDLPTAFESPRVRENGKDVHSRKPPQMYDWIRQVSGDVLRLECNARIAAEGFDAWGNEAPSEGGD